MNVAARQPKFRVPPLTPLLAPMRSPSEKQFPISNSVQIGVDITDALPLNAVLVAGTTTPGYSLSCRTPTFALGSLAAGEGANLVVAIKPKVTGRIINRVSVAGDETDPNTTNNFAKARANVIP